MAWKSQFPPKKELPKPCPPRWLTARPLPPLHRCPPSLCCGGSEPPSGSAPGNPPGPICTSWCCNPHMQLPISDPFGFGYPLESWIILLAKWVPMMDLLIINHPQSTRFCRSRILEQIINQQGVEHCWKGYPQWPPYDWDANSSIKGNQTLDKAWIKLTDQQSLPE